MSGITSAAPPSNYGMMNSLITNAATVKQRLDQLTNQASTGLIGNTYAGLGQPAPPVVAQSAAAGRQPADLAEQHGCRHGAHDVTQTALTQLQSIASSFYAQLNNVEGMTAARSTPSRRRHVTRCGRLPACWIPRTAASTCSPVRTAAIRRCPIPTISPMEPSGTSSPRSRRRSASSASRRRHTVARRLRALPASTRGHVAVLGLSVAADDPPTLPTMSDRPEPERNGRPVRQPQWTDPATAGRHDAASPPPAPTCATCCVRWPRSARLAARR